MTSQSLSETAFNRIASKQIIFPRYLVQLHPQNGQKSVRWIWNSNTRPKSISKPRARVRQIAKHARFRRSNVHSTIFRTAKANEMQADYIVNIREIIQSLIPSFSSDYLLNKLLLNLPPAALFHSSVLKFKTFHRNLRDIMTEKARVRIVPRGKGKERRIHIQLAIKLYGEHEWNQAL